MRIANKSSFVDGEKKERYSICWNAVFFINAKRWCTKPRMEVVEKTRRLRYTCRSGYDSGYIAPLYRAVLHTLFTHTRVRHNAAAGREGSFLVPGL